MTVGLLSGPATSGREKHHRRGEQDLGDFGCASMPVKPNTAAMIAMMKNASAQLSMTTP